MGEAALFLDRQPLTTETCCNKNCHMEFAMPADYHRFLRENPFTHFYCPRGHRQWYTGKSHDAKLKEKQEEIERLRRLREEDRKYASQRLEFERNSKRAIKGHLTRTKRRVGNGVCPCCNRTFKDLARHMKGQHPDYVE